MAPWPKDVCELPLVWRTGDKSIIDHLEPARGYLARPEVFLTQIETWIRLHPELVDAWIGFSEDQRASPAPYFSRDEDGADSFVVGRYDSESGRVDETRYTDGPKACADFIYRESAQALEGRRVTAH